MKTLKEFLQKLTRLEETSISTDVCEVLDKHAEDCLMALEQDQSGKHLANELHETGTVPIDSSTSKYLRILCRALCQLNPMDTLSINDQSAIKEAIGFAIAFGILPNLDSPIKTHLSKRFQKDRKSLPVGCLSSEYEWGNDIICKLIYSNTYLRDNLLYTCTMLCEWRHAWNDNLCALLDTYLMDVLAGFMQLNHNAPNNTLFEKAMQTIMEKSYKAAIIGELMCLQKIVGCSWLLQSTGQLLSRILCVEGGLAALIQTMQDSVGEDCFQDFTRILGVVKIVTSCPAAFKDDTKKYFILICKQVSGISKSWSRDTHLQCLFSCIVRRLHQIYSFGVCKYIINPLFEPIRGEEVCYSNLIHVLHSIYSCGPSSELSLKFKKPLLSVFHIFILIYCQNLGSVELLKKKLVDLICLCWEAEPDTFLAIITNRNDNTEFESNLHFKIVGDDVLKSDNEALDMDTKLNALDNIVQMFSSDKRGKVLVGGVKYTCRRISYVSSELKKLQENEAASSDSKCLLNLEDNERLSLELLSLTSLLEHITTEHEKYLISDSHLLIDLCSELFAEEILSEECQGLLMGLISSVLFLGEEFDPSEDIDRIRRLISSCAKLGDSTSSPEISASASDLCQLLASSIGEIAPPTSTTDIYPALKARKRKEELSMEMNIEECLTDLKDALVPVRGHAIICLTRIINRKNPEIIKHSEKIYQSILDQLSDDDSYIFLASINCLCALASENVADVLPKLLQVFLDSKNRSSDVRAKCAEAITRLIQQMGDLCPSYADQLMSPLLDLTTDKEAQVVCSALSSIGVLTCHVSFKITTYLREIILLVDGFLCPSVDVCIKRGAVHLLRCLLIAAQNLPVQILTSELNVVYRKMKMLCTDCEDTVLEVHAQLCIAELNTLIDKHCLKQDDKIKVLRVS